MSQSRLPAKLGPCQMRVTTEDGVATISINDAASANTFAVLHRLEKWWVTVDALDHCVSDGWVAFPNHADAVCPARPMGSNSGLHGIGQTQSSHGLAMLEFPKMAEAITLCSTLGSCPGADRCVRDVGTPVAELPEHRRTCVPSHFPQICRRDPAKTLDKWEDLLLLPSPSNIEFVETLYAPMPSMTPLC